MERAGFETLAHVEYDRHACATLRLNRPKWNVVEGDVRNFSAKGFKGVDLVAGGVPCPPFSKAGKQLGSEDERDLFPEALRLVDECRPNAVMLENVRAFLDAVFTDCRLSLKKELKAWESLGVNGISLANSAPPKGYAEMPRLTLRMTARIQGFPDDWQFAGGKTAAYRQIGNAFPPPVANAVALRIREAITKKSNARYA